MKHKFGITRGYDYIGDRGIKFHADYMPFITSLHRALNAHAVGNRDEALRSLGSLEAHLAKIGLTTMAAHAPADRVALTEPAPAKSARPTLRPARVG